MRPSSGGRLSRIALGCIPAAILVFTWHLSVTISPRLEFFLGSPLGVARSIVRGLADGSLVKDGLVTGGETLAGFIIGNVGGLLVGIGLWWLPRVAPLFRPTITGLGAAPLFAVAPLLTLWFGTGFTAKVAVAALSTFFVALSHAFRGINAIPESHVRLVRSFGGTRRAVFSYVGLPAMIQWVSAAFRLNVGFALLGAFVGEFLSAEAGLGRRILVATGLFDMSEVLAGVVCLLLLALLLHGLVSLIERVTLHVLRS